MVKYEELSKEVSYALRHAPWEYELEMDEEGWVSIEQLLNALNTEGKFGNITRNDLVVMIDNSEKKNKKQHSFICAPISFNYFTYNVCIYPNVRTCDCF